jgi:hypothetical protein
MNHGQAAANPVARWIAHDSFPARPPDLAVFRYRAMALFPAALCAVGLVMVVTWIISTPAAQVSDYVALPIVAWWLACLEYLLWARLAVRVRPDGVIFDNLLVRHVIPWEEFAGMFTEPGQGMFARLNDGRRVKSAAYGRSLADALDGQEHLRQTLGQVRAACQDARIGRARLDPAPAYRRSLTVPWRALLVFGVFFECVSWIAFAAHGG